MLSIGKMTSGQHEYYLDLAREDYYLQGGEPPGSWFGQGAEELGLIGQVYGEDLREVFQGSFRGRALVQNANNPNRCPGWDLVFSAPKSVSVLWSQVGGNVTSVIRAAHEQAVKKALTFVEDVAGITRRGKGGYVTEPAKLIFALFEHGTSRAQDPQLHTHSVLVNAGLRADGTTGALHTPEIYRIKMAAGALYRAEFAYLLERQFSLVTKRDGSCFQIEGVPEALIKEFSKRRQQIRSRLSELGQEGAIASERIALTTRTHKAYVPRKELIANWRKTGERHHWSTKQAEALTTRGHSPERLDAELAAKLTTCRALDRITEGQNTFSRNELIRFTAEEAQTERLGANRVRRGVADEIANNSEIVRVGEIKGVERFTTKEVLELENHLLARAKDLSEKLGPKVTEEKLQAAIDRRPTITSEQQEAVKHITQSEGNIKLITGDAGTGKSFMLGTAREALTESGYKVIGAALAGKAARGLEEESTIPSNTIASLLAQLDRSASPFNEAKEHAQFENWVRDMKKCGRISPEANLQFDVEKARKRHQEGKLPDKTVLVIDEAGMVSTKQMVQLVDHIERSGASLVLVGDPKQLQAIERGGSFKALYEKLDGKRLRDIYRQRNPAEKQAVRDLSQGQAARALAYYAKEGRLTVEKDREAAARALINDWAREGISNPKPNLILCATRLDATIINREIQDVRLQAGLLEANHLEVGGERIHTGDRIVFRRRDKHLGIENGDFGTVTSLSPKLGLLSVELDSGRSRTISIHQYQEIKPGYAVTSHSAQGATEDNAFILTHEAMQDREITYVQASRVREKAHLYTTEAEAGDELKELANQMNRSRQKELAVAEMDRAKKQRHGFSL